MPCENCGAKNAVKTYCPYIMATTGKVVEITVCDSCHDGIKTDLENLLNKDYLNA